MKMGDLQIDILLILADEKGHTNNDLARLLDTYDGGISRAMWSLRKKGTEIVEELGLRTKRRSYDYYIKKDKDVYKTIINHIFNEGLQNHLEMVKAREQFQMLIAEPGDWLNDNLVELSIRADECKHLSNYYHCCFNEFVYSQYTGKMIKIYGIKVILESLPRFKPNDYIKFVDWADDNGYTKSEDYMGFILSLSDYMSGQFEKKSKKFSLTLEEERDLRIQENLHIDGEKEISDMLNDLGL